MVNKTDQENWLLGTSSKADHCWSAMINPNKNWRKSRRIGGPRGQHLRRQMGDQSKRGTIYDSFNWSVIASILSGTDLQRPSDRSNRCQFLFWSSDQEKFSRGRASGGAEQPAAKSLRPASSGQRAVRPAAQHRCDLLLCQFWRQIQI